MTGWRGLVPWFAAATIAAPLGACRREQRPGFTLRDTEGRRFEARCEPAAGCRLKQTGGPRDPSGRSGVVLHRQALLTVVCSAAPGSAEREDVRDCRALECATDRDCPPEPGGPRYGHCIGGLCDPTVIIPFLCFPDTVIGEPCGGPPDCCTDHCVGGACADFCFELGDACSTSAECCSGTCRQNLCVYAGCGEAGTPCTSSANCCSNRCDAASRCE